MKIYSQKEKIEYPSPCIALGNFDGLHAGHREVISKAKKCAESFGVLLFDVHSNENIKLITTLSEKLSLLEKMNVDFAVIVNFDDEFKNMSCEEFAHYLKTLGVKAVSVGYDYRCAKYASADCDILRIHLLKYGIDLIVSEPVMADGEAVKSTKVRELILSGDIKYANRLLTRPFSLTGCVTDGKKNGRLMGFPTANIEVETNKLLPEDGVYVGTVFIDKAYRVILNVGKNPTFNAEKRTVEAHIIDFDGDLYGKEISVNLFEKIRDCRKFSSPKELARQLETDKEYAINYKE